MWCCETTTQKQFEGKDFHVFQQVQQFCKLMFSHRVLLSCKGLACPCLFHWYLLRWPRCLTSRHQCPSHLNLCKYQVVDCLLNAQPVGLVSPGAQNLSKMSAPVQLLAIMNGQALCLDSQLPIFSHGVL